MTGVIDKEPVHTFLDDIKFQSVKENNRRTSFVSTDHQIVAKNARDIKDIEKLQRLKTADFKRQENAYLRKLEKLHHVKDKNRKCESSPHNTMSDERRHSAPTVFWAQLSQSSQTPLSVTRTNTNLLLLRQSSERSNTMTSHRLSPRSTSSSSQNENEPRQDDQNQNPPSPMNTLARMVNCKPTLEARRMSYDLQQVTSREAMKKLDLIVKNHSRRRATIAEGVQSDFLPLVGAKSGLVGRSSNVDLGVEEDECFG